MTKSWLLLLSHRSLNLKQWETCHLGKGGNLQPLKGSPYLSTGALWWSQVRCWLVEDHRVRRSSWPRESKASDHWTRLHSEGSKWCTFLGLLQGSVQWPGGVLPALLRTQSVPAHLHEGQWEEHNPPWAAAGWAEGPPGPLRRRTVPGGEGAGCFHGDRGREGGGAAGTSGSVCCRCGRASRGHHASIAQEPKSQ